VLTPRTLAGALLVAVLAACATPSIPIPPPSPENMAFEVDADAGNARFSYRAESSYAGAIVYVFNRDAGAGVITTADGDGAVDPTDPFPAADGDEVVVTFELEHQLASTCVRVADGQSSSSRECGL
jgi:hypothetical protein